MFSKIVLFPIFLFACLISTAQITTDPAWPTANQKIKITFDSSKESRLGYFTGDLYAHTGVIINGNTSWQHVIESWGNNSTQPKLTNLGNGIHELEITPDVYSFYNFAPGEKVVQLAFVFRSSDSKKQTDNIFIDIKSLLVEITAPSNKSFFDLNQNITISAKASQDATIKLFVNGNFISQNNGTTISANYTFSQSGTFWIKSEANKDAETALDSILVYVNDGIVTSPKPAAYKPGINYPDNNSAALVLWAPLKDSVYVIGDFNDWKPTAEFKMNKDNNYYWLEIQNLESGKEYAFQYLIDGKIKVADPYTEKILDPWNDSGISDLVYPNLIKYPSNKTTGIVSVLQPGQEKYNWQTTNFTVPEKEKLVIYELLVRDFMTEHTYKAVREKLDYLEDLRINVLELMPVNEFEGNSSWGYNPSFYFAPDKYYGPKNELKALVDECHKRGIAVVLDMVLNHSYGQSPFVQMYMNNWTILPENPWYNVTSPNPVYQWGNDFNHETDVVKELVDSVNSFWMNEYKIDGFRFDFTKGFTNTPGDGWAYDESRINILKRMSDQIWSRKKDALVIFEHLADNSEETELANHGILLWGNMHWNYEQAANGSISNSDLSWSLYNNRGWSEPNLVSYPESHDEERIMYVIKKEGLSSGDYNIKNETTALKRIELNSVFNLPLPGPKMIWQFGERGYDQSINRCEGGAIADQCRLSPKPPYWEYLENTDRVALFHVMAKLNELKQKYNEFTPESFETSLNGAIKWYKLKNGENHVVAVGNFDIQNNSSSLTFPKTGKWYEFFTRDSIEINTGSQNIQLNPGEYRLYSTRNFDDPHVVTENKRQLQKTGEIKIYPNPASNEINISAQNMIDEIRVYSLTGKLLIQSKVLVTSQTNLNIERLTSGIYLLQVFQEGKFSTSKLVVSK